MREDEYERHVGNLPVELNQGVLTERCGYRLKSCHQRELHSQHRHPDKSQSDREFRPEPSTRRIQTDDGEHQRNGGHRKIQADPGKTASNQCHEDLPIARSDLSSTPLDMTVHARGRPAGRAVHRRWIDDTIELGGIDVSGIQCGMS
ncbi:hypothetical protein ACQP1O_10100 [Nocardia sp. CA-151230]|uniref:hypothetical protein n=1 Tax=Nocardia sp. CA-151230 TaxID=3239982 RepID=UPI003D8C79AA